MEKNLVKLTPVQAGAYWCINMIRNKVKEISNNSDALDEEYLFLQVFYNYTDVEWRKVYLELIEHFTVIANNKGYDFFLDTEIGEHDILNAIISTIIKTDIPDINLAPYNENGIVIFIKNEEAMVWYKSCNDMILPEMYESNYVLTGNQEELEIHNILVATLSMIGTLDPGFKSIQELRERFCKEYKKVYGLEENLEELFEKFDAALNRINGNNCSDSIFPSINPIETSALKSYMDIGHHFADVVLQRENVYPLPEEKKLTKDN